LASRLAIAELEDRIDCFGEFERGDSVCRTQCGLNFECALAKEHLNDYAVEEEALKILGCVHNA